MHALTALTLLTSLALTTASPVTPRSTTPKYLFIFGDSYTATGFNPSSTKPSASNPLGNPPLPGSTFSGSHSWPGFLATSFNTSLTLTYNYAVGGATVDSAVVAPPGNGIPSFVEQTNSWRSGAGTKPSYAPWSGENALAGAFFGINDILQSYWRGGDAPVSRMADRYFAQFEAMYALGVRNFFVLTVPPMDKVPQIMGQSASGRSRIMGVVNGWNSQLASRLATFKAQGPGVTAVVVDSAVALNKAVANPRAYGAPDATCLNRNGRSCLWWDNLHPGEAIQRLFAEEVAKAWRGSFF
ncbi:carbohydrate esterase family 16 protein [Podospora aff. communis PSN243]|uniref:Carbohydrate esterase family 16 protein n=1 Tax=Podospora aff. communis PSN243 TaxID=3040156 RepID=A0AAV9GHI2_9PEZI|nr:carbohydrate esterase family 16 protein [Podospora aff. communis PSN243]